MKKTAKNKPVKAVKPAKTKQPKVTMSKSKATSGVKQTNKGLILGLNILAILLMAAGFVGAIGMAVSLCLYCSNLVPYYTFWPFVGTVLIAVFALVFLVVAVVVLRKKSPHSFRYQAVAVLTTFLILTVGFGVLMDVVFPDVIQMATQNTLHCEDVYRNVHKQADKNAKIERDFIIANLLAGNYGNHMENEFPSHGDFRDFAYVNMAKTTGSDTVREFINPAINQSYKTYKAQSKKASSFKAYIEGLEGRRLELYNFIYNTWILNDRDYALAIPNHGMTTKPAIVADRQCVCLAMTDYTMAAYDYLCNAGKVSKDGVPNRTQQLFLNHHASMDQDGYTAFDDPLLLFAQVPTRMGAPVILRLILNQGYTITQGEEFIPEDVGSTTDNDKTIFDGVNFNNQNYLFEMYDLEFQKVYEDNYAKEKGFKREDADFNEKIAAAYPFTDANGEKYGRDHFGNVIFANGMTKHAMKWVVLDMLDVDMVLVDGLDILGMIPEVMSIDLGGSKLELPLREMLYPLLGDLGVSDGVADLLDGVRKNVVTTAANGATLSIGIASKDDVGLAISLCRNDSKIGVHGYQYQAWLESNNLLFAVISLVGQRGVLLISGSIGLVLLLIALVIIEYTRKVKERDKSLATATPESVNAMFDETESAMDQEENKIEDFVEREVEIEENKDPIEEPIVPIAPIVDEKKDEVKEETKVEEPKEIETPLKPIEPVKPLFEEKKDDDKAKEVKEEVKTSEVTKEEEPKAPVAPVKPEAPKAPVAPVKPEAPKAPVAPVKPEAPKAPVAPVKPEAPKAPVAPVKPEAPKAPVAPVKPEAPKAPVAPVKPEAPKAPVAPVKPEAPKAPVAPVKPEAPKAPVAPVKPEAPKAPVAPAKPDAPKAPAAPAKPVAPTKPATPVKPAAPAKPAPAKPAPAKAPAKPAAKAPAKAPAKPAPAKAPTKPAAPKAPAKPTAKK